MKVYELSIWPYTGSPDKVYLLLEEGKIGGAFREMIKNQPGGLEKIAQKGKTWELGEIARVELKELTEKETQEVVKSIDYMRSSPRK